MPKSKSPARRELIRQSVRRHVKRVQRALQVLDQLEKTGVVVADKKAVTK